MRRLATLALLLALTPGCPVLAPVVGTRETREIGGGQGCRAPACALLTQEPPETLAPDGVRPPIEGCDGYTRQTITMTQSLTLDASTLHCVDLDVTVEAAPASELTTLTLRGSTLNGAHIHVTSSLSLASIAIATHQVSDATLRIDGAIRLSSNGTTFVRSTIELGGDEPIDPPEALFVSSAFVDVRITGPRAPLRFRDTSLAASIVSARSVALERGSVGHTRITGDLVELLDVGVASTWLDVGHLIVTGGRVRDSFVSRCDAIVLAATEIYGSRIAACADAVVAERAGIGDCIVAGSLVGHEATVTGTVFGGDEVAVDNGIYEDIALCGTHTLRGGSVSCLRCEARAPEEVCIGSFDHADACPGLCAAACDAGDPPAVENPSYCAE